MSNQLHGIFFEKKIQALYEIYDGSHTNKWDIPAKEGRLPVSIKTTKNNTVGLSDARRIFDIDCDWKLIVGVYKQSGSFKQFVEIREYIITANVFDFVKGTISGEEIENFHNTLLSFPKGHHKKARLWARNKKNELQSKSSFITLNPKIDSKNQRRLQCSIKMTDLDSIITPKIYTDDYMGLKLSTLQVNSLSRKFNGK
jgi:hypothetical protein